MEKQSTFFIKFSFFVFGVSSLLGWNAVLTAFDYFALKYQDYNVAFDLPIPCSFANCLTGLLLPKIAIYLSVTYRIAGSLVISSIGIILLPLVATFYPNSIGFYISMGISFLLGHYNGLLTNTCLGIGSILGGEYVGIFFIGTGMSGTVLCTFRIICIFVFGENEYGKSALVYFCISGGWNIFAVFIYILFLRTEQYRQIEEAHQFRKNKVLDITETDYESSELASELNLEMRKNSVNEEENAGIFSLIFSMHKMAFPFPLCVIINYIQTFMVFPGLALEATFDQKFRLWGPTLVVLTFNIGDTIGKSIAGFRNIYNALFQYIILLSRFGFFISYIMIVQGVNQIFFKTLFKTFKNIYFILLNSLAFSITNGFCTGGFMTLGPEQGKVDKDKEKIGFVSGFSLALGILLGTFLALPLQGVRQG